VAASGVLGAQAFVHLSGLDAFGDQRVSPFGNPKLLQSVAKKKVEGARRKRIL
jgi:hypothetical protein